MATFAPSLPQGPDREYLKYSSPISGIEGNKSGYYLQRGLGEAVEQGLTETDKTIHNYTEQKAFQLGDEARKREEENLGELEKQFGLTPDANTELKASAFQPTELDGSGSVIQKNIDLPPEIRFGTKQAAALNERFVNGKITQTDYASDVAKIAKDLNAQFPSYRNDISRGLERATGMAGADAEIRARVSRLNEIMSQLKEQHNKVETKFMDAAKYMPDKDRAALLYRRYSIPEGQPGHLGDEEALYHAGKYEYHDKDNERILQEYAVKEKQQAASKEDFNNSVDKIVANNTERFMHSFTVGTGHDTLDQLVTKLNDPNLSDTDKFKVGQAFQQSLDAYKAQLRKDLGPLMGTKGSSGYGAVNQKINDATAFFDEQAKRIRDTNDPLNPIMSAKNYAESQKRDIHWLIAKQPEAIKRQIAKAIDDLNPELAGRINQDILANEKDFTANNKGLYAHSVRSFLGIPRKNPAAPVAKDYLDALADEPKAAMDIVKISGSLRDRGMPDEKAYRIADAFFNSKNQGMVGKWEMDSYDPRTGKTKEGQISVFNQLGRVADRILELSHNPRYADILPKYTDFMQNTFKREVFPTLLDSVKNLSVGAGNRLSYDSDTQQFDIRPKQFDMTNPTERAMSSKIVQQGLGPYERELQSTKNKLNILFRNMREVAKISGEKDPNSYILRLITEERPNAFSREVPGFPGEINKAIQNQALAKEIEKQQKAKAITESQE